MEDLAQSTISHAWSWPGRDDQAGTGSMGGGGVYFYTNLSITCVLSCVLIFIKPAYNYEFHLRIA